MSELLTHLSTTFKKYPWLWLIPILWLSLGLALPHFTQDAIWFDEVYTHLYSGTGRTPVVPFLERMILSAQTAWWPPLSFFLNSIWGNLVGSTPLSDYLFHTYVSLITLSVVFQFGKRLHQARGGIIASLMIATSAFFIHYTHEIRAYTMYVLVVVLVGWFYWMILTRQSYRRRWLRWGFPLSIATALYTHYVASAFILGILIYHILIEWRNKNKRPFMSTRRWWDIAKLWLNGCIFYAPGFAVLLATLSAEASEDRAVPFLSLMQSSIYAFSNNLWIIILPLLLGTLLLWKNQVVRFLWVWLLSSLVFVFFVNLFASFLFHPRHIFPYLMIIILLIIPGLTALEKHMRGISTLLIGIIVGAGIIYAFNHDFMYTIPRHVHQIPLVAMEDMTQAVEQCVSDDTSVVFAVDTFGNEKVQVPALQYYFTGTAIQYEQLGYLIFDHEGEIVFVNDEANYQERVSDFVANQDTVWLMSLPNLPNKRDIWRFENYLAQEGYQGCAALSQYENADIWPYTRNDNCEMIITSCQ